MDSEILSLAEKRVDIRYSDGAETRTRSFLLREMTAAELDRYIKLQLEPFDEMVEAMADYLENPSDAVSQSLQELYKRQTQLFCWLLRHPLDGGQTPALEWIDMHVSWKIRARIVAIQDELNGLERLEGNARALRETALARREARRAMAEYGSTSSRKAPPRGTAPESDGSKPST